MEKSAGGMLGDKCIPGGSTGLIEQSQSDCHAALRGNALSACRISNTVSEHTIHPVPGKIVQQPIQPSGHICQIIVMAEARFPAAVRHTRLVRVDLPRMEIKHTRPARTVDRRKTETEGGIG